MKYETTRQVAQAKQSAFLTRLVRDPNRGGPVAYTTGMPERDAVQEALYKRQWKQLFEVLAHLHFLIGGNLGATLPLLLSAFPVTFTASSKEAHRRNHFLRFTSSVSIFLLSPIAYFQCTTKQPKLCCLSLLSIPLLSLRGQYRGRIENTTTNRILGKKYKF